MEYKIKYPELFNVHKKTKSSLSSKLCAQEALENLKKGNKIDPKKVSQIIMELR